MHAKLNTGNHVQVAIKLTTEMEQDNTQTLTGKLALKEHRQPENWK